MNRRKLGLLGLLTFALLSSGRDVFAKDLFNSDSVDPVYLIWFASVWTWVIFYIKASFEQKRPYIFKDVLALSGPLKLRIGLLNLATLIAFAPTMLAVKSLNAYTNAVIDYGATPLVATGLAVWLTNERPTKAAMVGMVLSFVGIAFLAKRLVNEQTNSSVGITFAILSCVAIGFCQILTRNILKSGITRDRLMINRLLLLIVALGFWCLHKDSYHSSVSLHVLIFLSVLGVSVPLYLMIFALEKLEVKDTSLAFFLIPVFTLFGTILRGHFGAHTGYWPHVISGIVVLAGVIITERSYATETTAQRFTQAGNSSQDLH